MLSEKDNGLLAATGPGTPMGTLFRRFWLPALLSKELAHDGRDPVRIQLLSESFVAWRDGAGKVAIFDEACPHRCASLALARCEGDGLRCIYHGWKFDIDGAVIEAPNTDQPIPPKVRAKTFPCREEGGIIWVYLGPTELTPDLPHLPFFDAKEGHRQVTKLTMNANWLQSLEGHLDSSHASILHQDWDPFTGKASAENAQFIRDEHAGAKSDDIRPTIELRDQPYGFQLAALRSGELDGRPGDFTRVHLYVLPSTCVVPPRSYLFEVPIDDQNVNMYLAAWDPDRPMGSPEPIMGDPKMYTVGACSDARTFDGTAQNRWFQDRESMRTGESFSGIPGFVAEDSAIVVSMGPLVSRAKEHLVAADIGVVRVRRLLLQALKELSDGKEPFMPEKTQQKELRAGEGFLESGQRWHRLVPDHNN